MIESKFAAIDSFMSSDLLAKSSVGAFDLFYMTDGIIYCRVRPEPRRTVETLKELAVELGRLSRGKKVPILVWYDEMAIPEKDNREHWAKSDSSPFTSAEAYIIQTAGMKLSADFYSQVELPSRPTNFFENPNEAVVWLKTFLNN